LQLVVFPGEPLNLHIFEPRYRQLMQECEEEDITFGIPAFINGNVVEVGTELRLVSVEKRYADGELDVKTEGVGLFRIRNFYKVAPGKLYAGADVETLEGDDQSDLITVEKILDHLRQLFALLRVDKELPESLSDFNTYEWAHHVGFSLEEEYKFLCMLDETERQEVMLEHLERVLPTVREIENLRQRVMMNGHFKNIVPPKL
jgi:hypothetical protein